MVSFKELIKITALRIPLNLTSFVVGVLLFACAPLFAQPTEVHTLNPNNDEQMLLVRGLTLEGFSSIDDYPIDIPTLKSSMFDAQKAIGDKLSIADLHNIADQLTIKIREQGFSFHTVYLPPQRVVGGRVLLVLQEGILADVKVLNNTELPDKQFTRPFKALIGELLHAPTVENRVYALKSQPGFKVFAFYSRGKKAGEARLNLRVDKSKTRSFSAKIENYGSDATGENRLMLQYSEFQLTGRHDRLSLAVLSGIGERSTYGSLNYHLPLGALDWSVDFHLSNNDFDVSGEAFENQLLVGAAETSRIRFDRKTKHKPGNSKGVYFGIYNRASEVESNAEVSVFTAQEESSRALFFGWRAERSFANTPWTLRSNIEGSQGQYSAEGGSSGAADGEAFSKLNFEFSLVRQGQAPSRWANLFTARVKSQYSNETLPGLERQVVAGAYAVRSTAPGTFAGDRTLLMNTELSWPRAFKSRTGSWRARPFIFADWAEAEKLLEENSGGSSSIEKARFSGVGLGLAFNLGKHVAGKFTYGKPIQDDVLEDSSNNLQSASANDSLKALWLFELRWF